jgi:membrane protein
MKFKRIKQFVRRIVAAIIKHNIGALAAVIAFFGFSAMIPLFLLLIYGASLFIPHTPVKHFLSDVLNSYVPTIPYAKLYLTQNVSRLAESGHAVGIFGVFGLLWTAVGGFVSFQQILDVLWEIRHRRSFVKQYLVGFGMLGILLTLTVISSLVTAVSPMLMQKVFPGGNITLWLALVHDISRVSFPLLLFLTCYFCYRFLPSHTMKNSYLLIGASISTVGIYASRGIFVWYTRHLGHYELIYGSLTFIMLFTFWVYIVCIIVLFGAEFALSLRAVIEHE